MSLRFICIELRKQLHCANVFLQFDQSLTETEFLKINVYEDVIRLREYSTETSANVSQHFTIEARTMSNLTVEECNASFRLSISNISDNKEDEDQKSAAADSTNKTELKLLLQENHNCTINCKNCKVNLIEAQNYERLREFPSGTIDISEFFCHHGPNFDKVLVPSVKDLFYGFLFIVLNVDLLKQKTKVKDSHVYCKRCLQHLGEILFDGKAIKLWTDTLKYGTSDNVELRDIFKNNLTSTAHLLHKLIKESSIITEPLLQQLHFTKILLEATFSNRKSKYLLVNILEKQLEVLRNSKPLAHGSHNNNNVLHVQLEPWKCFKLLYRFIDALDESDNIPALLAYWQQNIDIHTLKISPTLFSALLQEMNENALLLPELHRYTHDDFQISYVFYEN